MKHKQLLLFLCVTAICYHLSIPVMAQDNNLIQQEDVIYQEIQSIENIEFTEDDGLQETNIDFSDTGIIPGVQEASDFSNEDTISDGWQQNTHGDYYYYQNGNMLRSTIAEIEDSNGEIHAYYFNASGRLFDEVSSNSWCYIEELSIGGYIATDEYGYLIKGWDYDYLYYYGENYFRYENQILEEDGKLYYFGNDGELCTDTTVVVDGIAYSADSNGILIPIDMFQKIEWVKTNDCWYLYVNGELVKDQLYIQGEKTYYLDADGKMQTGVFLCYEVGKGYRYRFADQNGVIQYENNWYLMNGDWYYVEEDGCAVCERYCIINNQKYYFDNAGKMVTGVFEAYDYNETTESYEYCSHLANSSGVVQSNTGWNYQGDSWYYINEDGILVRDCFILNNNYYVDPFGRMQIGRFGVYNINKQETNWYYAREDGVVLKNQWIKAGLVYYYAGNDGSLLNQTWIDDTYYFDSDGIMVVGSYEIDGTIYEFSDDGRKIGSLEKKDGNLMMENGIITLQKVIFGMGGFIIMMLGTI